MDTVFVTICLITGLFILYLFIGVYIGNKYFCLTYPPFWKKEPLLFKLLFRNRVMTSIYDKLLSVLQYLHKRRII